MLSGGDYVAADCQRAVKILRNLMEFGPWSAFLEKYVDRGSEVAYLKMTDMGLTLSMVVRTDKSRESKNEEENYYKNIHSAMLGDIESLVWLAVKSSPHEAKEYIQKINAMQVSNIIVIPLKMYIVFNNFVPWLKGQLKEEDAEYITFCIDI